MEVEESKELPQVKECLKIEDMYQAMIESTGGTFKETFAAFLNEPSTSMAVSRILDLLPISQIKELAEVAYQNFLKGELRKDNGERRTIGGIFFTLVKNAYKEDKRLMDSIFSKNKKAIQKRNQEKSRRRKLRKKEAKQALLNEQSNQAANDPEKPQNN
eukprot:TRINITY_DN10911_c0_g1_i1.p1 TRINITY_DN10911_c0_g1~~TRINITY_DN10911_c0_g1_i1.p1  ORF type:complete len:159 (+),score=39.01 TRINITY_DN10911_c0_g1_i1:120-596(+)